MLKLIISLLITPVIKGARRIIDRVYFEEGRTVYGLEDQSKTVHPIRKEGIGAWNMPFSAKEGEITGLDTKNGVSRQMRGPKEAQEGGMIQSATLGAVNDIICQHREEIEQRAASRLSSMTNDSEIPDCEEFTSQQKKFFSSLSILEATLRNWVGGAVSNKARLEPLAGSDGVETSNLSEASTLRSDGAAIVEPRSEVERGLAEDQSNGAEEDEGDGDGGVRDTNKSDKKETGEGQSDGDEPDWEVIPPCFWGAFWES